MDELQAVLIKRAVGLQFLKKARDLGVVDDERLRLYVEQTLTSIAEAQLSDPLPATEKDPLPDERDLSKERFIARNRSLGPFQFLEMKGVDPDVARSRASLFGRLLKDAYTQWHGQPPEKGTNGNSRGAYMYTAADIELFESVYKEMFNGAAVAGPASS